MAGYPEPKNPLVFTSRREGHRFLTHPQLMMDTVASRHSFRFFATRSTEDNEDSDQPNKQTHDHDSSKNNPWNIAIMVMIITVIDSNSHQNIDDDKH